MITQNSEIFNGVGEKNTYKNNHEFEQNTKDFKSLRTADDPIILDSTYDHSNRTVFVVHDLRSFSFVFILSMPDDSTYLDYPVGVGACIYFNLIRILVDIDMNDGETIV